MMLRELLGLVSNSSSQLCCAILFLPNLCSALAEFKESFSVPEALSIHLFLSFSISRAEIRSLWDSRSCCFKISESSEIGKLSLFAMNFPNVGGKLIQQIKQLHFERIWKKLCSAQESGCLRVCYSAICHVSWLSNSQRS